MTDKERIGTVSLTQKCKVEIRDNANAKAVEALEKVKDFVSTQASLMVAESLDNRDLGKTYTDYFMSGTMIMEKLNNLIKEYGGKNE